MRDAGLVIDNGRLWATLHSGPQPRAGGILSSSRSGLFLGEENGFPGPAEPGAVEGLVGVCLFNQTFVDAQAGDQAFQRLARVFLELAALRVVQFHARVVETGGEHAGLITESDHAGSGEKGVVGQRSDEMSIFPGSSSSSHAGIVILRG